MENTMKGPGHAESGDSFSWQSQGSTVLHQNCLPLCTPLDSGCSLAGLGCYAAGFGQTQTARDLGAPQLNMTAPWPERLQPLQGLRFATQLNKQHGSFGKRLRCARLSNAQCGVLCAYCDTQRMRLCACVALSRRRRPLQRTSSGGPSTWQCTTRPLTMSWCSSSFPTPLSCSL